MLIVPDRTTTAGESKRLASSSLHASNAKAVTWVIRFWLSWHGVRGVRWRFRCEIGSAAHAMILRSTCTDCSYQLPSGVLFAGTQVEAVDMAVDLGEAMSVALYTEGYRHQPALAKPR